MTARSQARERAVGAHPGRRTSSTPDEPEVPADVPRAYRSPLVTPSVHAHLALRVVSLRAMLWALHDAPVPDPTAALILLGLADHARDNGTASWPSRRLLAHYGRCSRDTVDRRLRRLLDDGVIALGDQRLVAHLPADRRSTVYDLNLSLKRADPEVEEAPSGRGTNPQPGPQVAAPVPSTGAAGQPDRGRRPAGPGPQLCGTEPSLNQEKNQGGDARVDAPTPAPAPPPQGPPLPRCADHHGTVSDGPCRACGDARRAFDAWRASQAAAPPPWAPSGSSYVPTVMCQRHPDEHAGSCGRCAHEGVRAGADLRRLRDQLRDPRGA